MALKKVGVELEASGASVFASQINDANQAVTTFGRDAEKAGGGVSAFGEIATGALRKVGAVAVEMGIAAGKAIAGFVSDSVKKAGDFQSGMNEFAAVTGGALDDSGKSLKDFSDLFIQMGRELPVSTADVQEAAIELAKGGIDPATIAAGGLRTSLDLAAAGGVELGDSANILAKQLGVWVDAAADADTKSAFLTQTANLLSQAANVTTSDVSDMALGLANAGGTAKTAGVSYQELVQTMALVSPGFSSAADAGTSLKTFLSRLIPTTKPAIAAMVDLGLATKDGTSKFYDATGSFIGMQAAAQLLQQQTAGLSEAQRLQAFQTIFGADAIRVAAAVAEKGGEGFAAMGVQMAAAGTVSEQAAARQQGYNTALENAKGSVEALQLTVGQYLLPILATLLNDYISPAINAVTTFADAFFQSSDKIGMLGTALTTLGTTVGTWITQQGPIWAAQILSWGEAFLSWIAPLEAQYLQYLGNLALAIGAWIVAQAPGWLAQLAAWGQALADWVAPYIPIVIAKLAELATSLWGWVKEQAPVLLAQLKAWGESLVAWIAPQIPPLLAKAEDLGKRLLAWIGDQAAPILAKLGEWAKSFVAWIGPATKDFLAKWPGVLDQFLAWIGTAAGPILAKLGEWTASFLAWVVAAIPPFLTAVAGIAAALLVWVGETAGVLAKELITKWIPAFLDWIADTLIPKLGPALQDVLDKFGEWIGTAATWIGKEVVSIGTAMVDGIKSGVSGGWDRFIGWINQQIAKIPAAIRKFLGIGSPSRLMAERVGIPIVQGIELGIDQETPYLESLVTQLGRDVPMWLSGGFVERQPLLRSTLADGIGAALSAMAERVKVDGASVVSAMEQMVASYNAAIDKIKQPEFSGGYADRGPNWDPNDPGSQRYTNFKPQYGSLPMSRNNTGYTAKTVSPPASASQQMMAASYSTTYAPTYNYAPSYGSAPNAPSQDFYIMQVLAR
jgi:TP901 family phage tail tape measure protein